MELLIKFNFELIKQVCTSRPIADHSVEQYLITAESLYDQMSACEWFLKKRRVLFVGDDDHLSILASSVFKTDSTVVEIDDRIIKNQRAWEKKLKLANHKIYPYDVRNSLDRLDLNTKQFDGFVINPPYGSKNQAYGAKVWISRALEFLKAGGAGLLIFPLDFDLPWSIANMLEVQKFLAENNIITIKIDNNLHTYEDLPDPNLRSSNIWVHYLGNAKNLISVIPEHGSIYR